MNKAPAPFRCEVIPRRATVRIEVHGELDLAARPEFATLIAEVTDGGFTDIVVDLRDLVFVDSTGLHALLDLQSAARRHGSTLTLIPGPPAVQRVFEIAGLVDALPFRAG